MRRVLFLHAQNDATAKPVIDSLTRRMCAAWRQARHSDYAYGGFHNCVCRATSTNLDYFLPVGEMTNSLCVHYLAHHRAEVSADDLAFVAGLQFGEAAPTDQELLGPAFVTKGFREFIIRQLGPVRLQFWLDCGLDLDALSCIFNRQNRSDDDFYVCLRDIPEEYLPALKQFIEQSNESLESWGSKTVRIPNWDRAAWLEPLAELVRRSAGKRSMIPYHHRMASEYVQKQMNND